MTSSDSAEDFESADEDFDFEPHPKQVKSVRVDEDCVRKERNDFEKQISPNSEATTVECLKNLQDLKLENNLGEIKDFLNKPPEDVQIPKLVTKSDEHPGITCILSHASGKFKDTSHEFEEQGTSLHTSSSNSSDDFVTDKRENEENKLENITPSNICQASENNKEIITSLQTEIKPELKSKLVDGWDIDEDLLCEENTLENCESKAYESLQIEEESGNRIAEQKAVDIKPKYGEPVLEQPKDIQNPQDGWENDGWEIEEEDGFEIPTTLVKTSGGSILCAQEQICELDRVEFEPKKQEQGWSGWGGWGVGSLLSTASTHVTAGLSTVLETAVGAPDPETLASVLQEKQKLEASESSITQEKQTIEEQKGPSSFGGFGSLVSGVSLLGSSVINRGLDTLETLGKKTMEVLQEGDPGLKKKRALLFSDQDKPVLSQILREAKEKADNCDKEKEEKETARKVHFESLFDDYQGMVHLEALEMLSTQCDLKLQSLILSQSGPQLEDIQETLSQVRDLCELADDDEETEVLTRNEFTDKVNKCVKALNIKITPAKIIKVNDEVISRLSEFSCESAAVVNQTAISCLAEFTAAAMECFHKSAELLLAKQIRNTPEEAENYVQLTSHLCARASAISNEFTQLLTQNHPIANSSIITNIFLEASNSCSYIRNACQLLVPILQVGAVSS